MTDFAAIPLDTRPLDDDHLTPDQRSAVDWVLAQLDAISKRAPNAKPLHRRTTCNGEHEVLINENRGHQVLAIEGPRGTGKTTVLLTALRRLLEPRPGELSHRPLPIIDFDPQPAELPLLPWLLDGFARLAHALEKNDPRCPPSRGDRAPGTLSREWRALLEVALRGWSPQTEHRSLADATFDRLEQIRDLSLLAGRYAEAVDSLLSALEGARRLSPGGLLVVPVDDVDLEVARAPELLDRLRFLYHPRVVWLLTLDRDQLEWSIYGHSRTRLSPIPSIENSRRGDLDRRAKRLAGELLSKALPDANIKRLPVLPVANGVVVLERLLPSDTAGKAARDAFATFAQAHLAEQRLFSLRRVIGLREAVIEVCEEPEGDEAKARALYVTWMKAVRADDWEQWKPEFGRAGMSMARARIRVLGAQAREMPIGERRLQLWSGPSLIDDAPANELHKAAIAAAARGWVDLSACPLDRTAVSVKLANAHRVNWPAPIACQTAAQAMIGHASDALVRDEIESPSDAALAHWAAVYGLTHEAAAEALGSAIAGADDETRRQLLVPESAVPQAVRNAAWEEYARGWETEALVTERAAVAVLAGGALNDDELPLPPSFATSSFYRAFGGFRFTLFGGVPFTLEDFVGQRSSAMQPDVPTPWVRQVFRDWYLRVPVSQREFLDRVIGTDVVGFPSARLAAMIIALSDAVAIRHPDTWSVDFGESAGVVVQGLGDLCTRFTTRPGSQYHASVSEPGRVVLAVSPLEVASGGIATPTPMNGVFAALLQTLSAENVLAGDGSGPWLPTMDSIGRLTIGEVDVPLPVFSSWIRNEWFRQEFIGSVANQPPRMFPNRHYHRSLAIRLVEHAVAITSGAKLHAFEFPVSRETAAKTLMAARRVAVPVDEPVGDKRPPVERARADLKAWLTAAMPIYKNFFPDLEKEIDEVILGLRT